MYLHQSTVVLKRWKSFVYPSAPLAPPPDPYFDCARYRLGCGRKRDERTSRVEL